MFWYKVKTLPGEVCLGCRVLGETAEPSGLYKTNIPAEETITTNHYKVLVQSQMTEIDLNNVRWNNNSWLE